MKTPYILNLEDLDAAAKDLIRLMRKLHGQGFAFVYGDETPTVFVSRKAYKKQNTEAWHFVRYARESRQPTVLLFRNMNGERAVSL